MTAGFPLDGSSQRTLRLIHNILGGIVGRVVTLAAPLLVMPLMLRYLGDVHFGIWMTAVAMASVAQFSDLGISNGLLTRLSAAIGREDDASARSDIASAYAMLTAVALFLAVLGVGALLVLSAGNPPTGGVTVDHDALAIVVAAFGAFLAGLPAGLIHRVMFARQQGTLSNIWQIVGTVLSVFACWAAVSLRSAPWAVVLAYGLPPVCSMVVAAIWYFARYPSLRPHLANIAISPMRDLLSIGIRFLSLGVLTSISLNADNLIIAANAGARAVTEYSVPAKVGSLLGLVITTIFLPLWPANGEAFSRGDLQWVRRNTQRMAWIGGIGVGITAIILAANGNSIIFLWMGRSFPNQQLILGMLGGFSIVMAITAPYNMILNASGQIKVQIVVWTFFALTSIFLKIMLVTEDRLWVIPLISLLMYALFITPVMWKAAGSVTRAPSD